MSQMYAALEPSLASTTITTIGSSRDLVMQCAPLVCLETSVINEPLLD